MPEADGSDEASFNQLFSPEATGEADGSNSSKGPDVPDSQTVSPAKQVCQSPSPGKVQAQISQFFGIPSPKAKRSAADQLQEAQAIQSQVESPTRVAPANGSLDRHGLPRQNVGGRPSKPDELKRGSLAEKGGNNSRKAGEKPLRYEPGAVEMHRISVTLNSKVKEFPDTDEGRMPYWKQMKQLFPAISRTKLGWVKDNE